MVFSSILFLFVYLPVVLAVYYIVPARYRNLWLFIVNLVFYGWGEPVYILLMVFSIALNYAAGLLIARYRLTDDKKARAVLTVNTVVNLALLIFFKYFDLLAATLSRIPGISIPRSGSRCRSAFPSTRSRQCLIQSTFTEATPRNRKTLSASAHLSRSSRS